jgi:type I restriction enzyme S subunit
MSIQRWPFLDIFQDASGGNIKTPQKDFLPEGEIPVVDQGQGLIAGYVNDTDRKCKSQPPVIVFGDHTRAIKYVDFEFAMGADGTKVLVPKVESNTKYLYYALSSLDIPSAGYSRHFKFLKETQIPLPPLAEQKRIAAILDAADALRAKRRETLAQLDTLLQSTFLDMFGDPVTNPKGWETKTIRGTNSLVQIGPFGSLLHKEDYISGGIPLINPKHIVSGKIVVGNDETITKEKAEKLKTYRLMAGDVIMGRRGEMGRCAVINDETIGMLCGTGSLFVRPNPERLTPLYTSKVLSSESMKAHLEKVAWGVTMANLNRTKIESLTIPLPPLAIQQKFATIVESTEQQKNRLRNHLTELDTLFASLQQRAFNGDL